MGKARAMRAAVVALVLCLGVLSVSVSAAPTWTKTLSMLSTTNGTTTTSCNCNGCHMDKHILAQVFSAADCAQRCEENSDCKVSVFDSERPLDSQCYLYPHTVVSIENNGMARYTCYAKEGWQT